MSRLGPTSPGSTAPPAASIEAIRHTSIPRTLEDTEHRYIPFGCLVYPVQQRDEAERRYRKLWNNEWIRVDTLPSVDDDTVEIARIYLLPDDTENTRIDRSHEGFKHKKKSLIALLDFSSTTWNGSVKHGAHSTHPALSASAQLLVADNDDDDIPLLKMFNTMPSPNPDPTAMELGFPREVMFDLLGGTIDGVVTELYPYQCRSAALMHQKEVQTTRFLDPRLLEVIDQEGGAYYYNSVTGDAFQEPRYYDSVRGGILAEEMGAGKTLICLALIAATRHQPAQKPELYKGESNTIRPRVGSLMDMAAAIATKQSCPMYVDPFTKNLVEAIRRNPGWYFRPRPERRRASRHPQRHWPPDKIYLSHTTLVVVPANLVKQWQLEINKHTEGLQVLSLDLKKDNYKVHRAEALLRYDIIICSTRYVEWLWADFRKPEQDGSWTLQHPLGRIHFKRCIVDEGHRLGNVRLSGAKNNLLLVLDALHMESRWIATGTPSTGLFGMEEGGETNTSVTESTAQQERRDLERIGSIATQYLGARPWANSVHDDSDTRADWRVYVMQPKHSRSSSGRKDCLRSTFNSLIIRHRLSEVSHLLPSVDTKIVKLDGSYLDKLALNIFSIMIIFNAVQSQRMDQDYFFHSKNRASLLQLFTNIRQSTFFGGAYFPASEIRKAVETAEEFIEKKKVPISDEDMELLTAGVAFGKLAADNKLKELAYLFREVPLYVKDFPGGTGAAWAWSMDEKSHTNQLCTTYKLMLSAQKVFRPFLESEEQEQLNTFLNSAHFTNTGYAERAKEMREAHPQEKQRNDSTLAGNATLGEASHTSPRRRHPAQQHLRDATDEGIPTPPQTPDESIAIAAPLATTQLLSTASAKLSYLLDAILTHQKEEQILIFYEHNNIAWYLAGLLELLGVHHLIYAKGITAERRAQYVATFNNSSKFRVLLMDISQAAFGLDMRSASRVYFIGPVLNPQVEAQAIGRVRRISQKRRVTVEVLVLKDSLEEVIVERRKKITQAEVQRCKTLLDDQDIYEWIRSPKIIPLPEGVDAEDGPSQMAPLRVPQYIFGREFGRDRSDPDEDILMEDPVNEEKGEGSTEGASALEKTKARLVRLGIGRVHSPLSRSGSNSPVPSPRLLGKRARFAESEGDSSGMSTPGVAMAGREGSPATAGPALKRARFAGEETADDVASSGIVSTTTTTGGSSTGEKAAKRARFADHIGGGGDG